MKQPNTDPKPRAYGVAMAICAQLPQFRLVDDYGETDKTVYLLRRPDGAGMHVYHHVNYPKGKQNITIVVEKIPEAPYGIEEPSGSWSGKTSQTNSDIAFDFVMNHYEAMQQYWLVALDARQKALDRYNSRLAFAHQLAAAGNGQARTSNRNNSPGQVPCTSTIDCFANKTSSWRVKYFGEETELIVRATDAQALAIVAMLAEKCPN